MAKRNEIFNSVFLRKPNRSNFNMSYENKFSANMGEMCPFLVMDILPHDTVTVGNDYLMRTQPLIAPLMHRVNVYQHYFFVPYRLIWQDFEKFITGGESGEETAQMPYITTNQIKLYSSNSRIAKLLDLLGYPTIADDNNVNQNVSSLRIRAYNAVYNAYFRDQNLMPPLGNPTSSTQDFSDQCNMELKNVCWKKDYFTSALPFAQRSAFRVGVPYSGGEIYFNEDGNTNQKWVRQDGTPLIANDRNIDAFFNRADDALSAPGTQLMAEFQVPANLDPNGTLKLSELGIDVEDIRKSNAIQRWLEKSALAGGRYIEQVKAFFGIHTEDYRLDRPEYLGGGKQPLGISEVVQTSSTIDESDTTTPQGNLSGKAISANSQFVFKHTFREHGILIGLMSVVPTSSYHQGIDRHLQKFDKFDFAFPEFAHLGEQEVRMKELFFDGKKHVYPSDVDPEHATQNRDDSDDIWGYQSRYAEYKFHNDECHGDFKTTLAYWHLGRFFSGSQVGKVPVLNGDFVTCNPRKDVFAVTTQEEDCLLIDMMNVINAKRCLPTYATPTL